MVDLPTVSRRLTTIDTPQSSLSAADVKAPFAQAARALTEVGETAGEFAEVAAEREGRAAVRTGDDGQLVVDHGPLPILGDAGKAFNRAARLTYVARVTPQVEDELTRLRLANPDDPEAFKAAAGAYSKRLLDGDDKNPGITDPLLRGPVQKTLEDNISQNYRTSLVAADRLNVSNAERAYKSRLESLDHRMGALARQGGVDTPEYQQAQTDLQSIYGELQSDRRFKFPTERAQQELAEMTARHKGEAVIGQAARIYDKATPTSAAEARKFLQTAAFDPGLDLSVEQRHQIVSRGMSVLDGRTAENKALVEANKKLVNESIEGLKTSAPYDERRMNDLLSRSAAIGDSESYYRLAAYKAFQPWRVVLNSGSVADGARAVRELQAGGGLAGILSGAESGNNPRVVNKLGYAGTFQFGAPRLATVGIYTPGGGENVSDGSAAGQWSGEKWSGSFNIPGFPEVRTINDFLSNPQAQRAAFDLHTAKMDEEIKTMGLDRFEGQTIGGVKITRPGIQAMMHLGGAAGARAFLESGGQVDRKDANGTPLSRYARLGARALPGQDAGGVWNEAVSTELVNDFRKKLGTEIGGMIDTAATALGKGRALAPDEVTSIAEGIRITGRKDLLPKLEQAMEAYDAAHGLLNQPQSMRAALRAQLESVAARGADPAVREVIDQAQKSVDATEKGMKEKPYSTGAVRGLHQPPGAFIWDNPVAVTVEAGSRVANQAVQRNFDGTGPISIFEKPEAEGLRTTLTQGDPTNAAEILNGLSQTLPADVFRATMTDDTMKQALGGMMRSYDPTRLSAAMTVMDRLWREDPIGFAREETGFGRDALKRLQVWQTWKDTASPLEIADRFKRADDPAMEGARERLRKEAEAEMKTVKAGDVATALGSSWSVTPGFVSRNLTGSDAAPPVDSVQSARLVEEYDTIYKSLREFGVEPSEAKKQAAERLKTSWGTSNVVGGAFTGGGVLMRFPPEKFYPQVNGSHGWLRDQVVAAVAEVKGPQVTRASEMAGGGTAWSLVGLAPDAQTEAEVSAGRPPSYRVIVQDNLTGRRDVIDRRFAFDPAADVRRATDQFNENRIGGPQPQAAQAARDAAAARVRPATRAP